MTTELDSEAAVALKLMGYKVRNFGGTMKVETYEIEEGRVEPQIEAEAIQLIEQMGLKGQRSLVVDGGESEKRIPYREMNKSERVVFEALLPKVDHVETYSAGVIPVRALQVIAHAKEFFDRIDVRHADTTNDALAVGIKGPSYAEKWSILARWGDNLLAPEKLREEAREVIRVDFSNKLKQCSEKCKEMIHNLDGLVSQRLSGETVSLPTIY